MTSRPPASPGWPAADIETPAVVVDLDALDRNLATMASAVRSLGVHLRPHAKAHKCAAIARLQLAQGAIGVCCQKVSEAEAMVAGGVDDVYVTNQVVAAPKLQRLAMLARRATVALAADSAEAVAAAAKAARRARVQLTVLVELDLGEGRAGVAPGEAAASLAARIAATGDLRFGGLQAYRSLAQHATEPAERRRLTGEGVDAVKATLAELDRRRIVCPTVSGGGTGSYRHEAESGVFTEVQPGSYVLMDAYYASIRDAAGGPFREFEHALFVETMITSYPAAGRAMCDAGTKAIENGYAGPPLAAGLSGVVYAKGDDEHGRLRWADDVKGPQLGERIRLIPGNCDPTINLHDWIVGVRDATVEVVWPVDARGPGL